MYLFSGYSIASVFALLVYPAQGLPRTVESLFASGARIEVGRVDSSTGGEAEMLDDEIRLRGEGGRPTTFVFRPAQGPWDFNQWNHISIKLLNTGDHLVRIEARLDNPGAVDWAHSFPGTAVVLAGSEGTLGFPFSRSTDTYDGPEIFRSQASRPNGHRSHWRPFDPSRVQSLRFTVYAAGAFELSVLAVKGVWPAGSDANVDLEELPYLDPLGQVRALQWPGKLESVEELRAGLEAEEKTVAEAKMVGMNRFGGWAAGPRRSATGYFRTEKIDGRWWFVDPEGQLFWSHGINSVGFHVVTPIPNRRELFAWLPEPGEPLHDGLIQRAPGRPLAANFLRANIVRAWGDDGLDRFRHFTHDRLRSWGINTLGGWSDSEMMRQSRTPYTLTTGTWQANFNQGGSHMQPDPFDPRFERGLRQALANFAWARKDPWCLGVFIDNELEWPRDLAPMLFAAKADQPAKVAFVDHLRERHGDIVALNIAWNCELKDWAALLELRTVPVAMRTETFAADVDAFYAILAERYFSICQRLMRESLPNHLYLGCRIHRAAPVAMEAAARYVDVFSSNSYSFLGRAAQIPGDVPVLITEFHFGAPDRGVPGTGLLAVHDQQQRGLAYTAYVVGGLLDPRIVGAHWFAFPDQSAAGRPGENYQIGFIDVTGQAYPEFTRAVGRLSRHLYQTRHQPPISVEAALESITKEKL
jgi:hypothetical protein